MPSLLIALGLLAGACTPAPTPTPTPSPKPAATVAPKPSPAVSPKPAASPPAKAQADGAAQPGAVPAGWNDVVAAAKREAKLVISGAARPDLRTNVTEMFKQAYPEIQIDFAGMPGRDFWPRVIQEHGGGQFLWDLRIGGPEPAMFSSRQNGILQPIRPLLVLPEVNDSSKWLGGMDRSFLDAERQYNFVFFSNVESLAWVNREFVPTSELRDTKDFVNPAVKGKIALLDPRGGAGQGFLMALIAAQGEPWVREFLTSQRPTVTGDERQIVEWVVRGRHPIGLGMGPEQFAAFREQGMAQQVEQIAGAEQQSPGFGAVTLMAKQPHPNASKLFINWLLTRDVQARLGKALEYNSRRLDVPPTDPKKVADPARLDTYLNYSEKFLPLYQQVVKVAEESLQ